jgi:hypothetical protein
LRSSVSTESAHRATSCELPGDELISTPMNASPRLAEQLSDSIALARAALGFCGPYRFHEAGAMVRSVVDLLERAVAALGDEGSPLRAQMMGRLAVYTDVAQGYALARQALEIT